MNLLRDYSGQATADAWRGLPGQQQQLIIITAEAVPSVTDFAVGSLVTFDVSSLDWVALGDPVFVVPLIGSLTSGDGCFGTCVGSISDVTLFETLQGFPGAELP